MKKFLNITLGSVLAVSLLLVLLVEPIDRTPYEETLHYRAWQDWIAQKKFTADSGERQAGWAKVNITPLEPGPMSGYGNRWGKHFEGIHDSLYVRSIALRDSAATVYFVSADMLIIPPNVRDRLAALLIDYGISLSDIHFGATHTHHGQGGWGQKLAGRLFSGKYNVETEERLASQFRDAIVASSQHLVSTNISYKGGYDPANVRNRLDVDGGTVDPWIRSLVFDRGDGKRAELVTYSAHPTILSRRWLYLSRDFPGALVDSLEKELDFAMYMAGAVGSMGAEAGGDEPIERMQNMATGVLEGRNDSVSVELKKTLLSELITIPMPDPSVRFSMNFALRPWVFRALFGEQADQIKVTMIGNALLVGVPADFSGELMRELDAYADARGIELIVTSFSGGYIGYITPDKLYEKDLYETMIMSWNGYQSGGYLTAVIKGLIDKLADN